MGHLTTDQLADIICDLTKAHKHCHKELFKVLDELDDWVLAAVAEAVRSLAAEVSNEAIVRAAIARMLERRVIHARITGD